MVRLSRSDCTGAIRPLAAYPRCGHCAGLFKGGSMTATCPLHPECTIGLLHHNCMLPHIGIFHRNHNISQEFDVAAEMPGTCVRHGERLDYKRCTRLGHHPSDREISALVPRRRALVERMGAHVLTRTTCSEKQDSSAKRGVQLQ